MAVFATDKLNGPDQRACPAKESFSGASLCPSTAVQGSCGHCAKAMEQLNQGPTANQPLPLGQVLLVFFLPLVCAAAMVITAIRFLPKLAEHPGYLVLSALGVACLAVVLAKIFTHGAKAPKRG